MDNGNGDNGGNGTFYFSHTFLGTGDGDRAVYHWIMRQTADCGLWELEPDSDTIGYWCREDAEAAGFRPCPHCNGGESNGRVSARVRHGGECDQVCKDGEDCREEPEG
jgi:hypothetical protein